MASTRELPRNIEAEQVVIGSAMLEPETSSRVLLEKKLLPEHFYEQRHRVIFSAIGDLLERGNPPDIIILANHLESTDRMEKAGGRMYLNELLDRTTTTASLEHYIGIVKEKAILRQIIESGARIEEMGYKENANIADVFSDANQVIRDIEIPEDKPPYIRLGDEVMEQIELLEKIHAQGGAGVVGVPSGFADLDKYTSGFRDSDFIIIAARPGVGKCLGKGTPILMFDGSIKSVEDVRSGDVLMGPDSAPRNVSGVTSGHGNLYKVTPVKGDPYVVNEHHVLSLKMSPSVPGDERCICNVSVMDYFAKPKRWLHHAKGWRCGVDWPEKKVSIDPYILGIWLGDGSKNKPTITTADDRVASDFTAFAKERGLSIRVDEEDGKANSYSATNGSGNSHKKNTFTDDLRGYGIYSNKSIPRDYLINSRAVRLEVLAGLLDSDGELSHGCYTIVQKSEIIADQVCFLARSLGLAAYMRTIRKKCCNNGVVGTYYSVTISGHTNEIPLRLLAKRAAARKIKKDVMMTGISVDPIGIGEYFGFAVDGDHLFMLGDFTVTHNSALFTSIARRASASGYGVGIFSLEMSREQILQRMLCAEGRISLQKMRGGYMSTEDWRNLTMASSKISGLQIFVDDTPGLSLIDVVTKARRMKENDNIDILFIDYIQLMEIHGFTRNREQEVAKMARTMKNLARELEIPVVGLSQLNRGTEQRKGNSRRPTLADLRESGSLEQEADIVIFIYRDDYYEVGHDEADVVVPAELIIAKQRNGPLGRAHVSFHKAFVDFYPNVYADEKDKLTWSSEYE